MDMSRAATLLSAAKSQQLGREVTYSPANVMRFDSLYQEAMELVREDERQRKVTAEARRNRDEARKAEKRARDRAVRQAMKGSHSGSKR